MLFTDLPAPTPENEAQWLAAQPSWRDSLRAEVLGLKLQASLLLNTELVKPHERRELERHKALTNDKLRPTRDAGGLCTRAAWGRLVPVQVTECPCRLVRVQSEVCLRRQCVFVQCVPACACEGTAVAAGGEGLQLVQSSLDSKLAEASMNASPAAPPPLSSTCRRLPQAGGGADGGWQGAGLAQRRWPGAVVCGLWSSCCTLQAGHLAGST